MTSRSATRRPEADRSDSEVISSHRRLADGRGEEAGTGRLARVSSSLAAQLVLDRLVLTAGAVGIARKDLLGRAPLALTLVEPMARAASTASAGSAVKPADAKAVYGVGGGCAVNWFSILGGLTTPAQAGRGQSTAHKAAVELRGEAPHTKPPLSWNRST